MGQDARAIEEVREKIARMSKFDLDKYIRKYKKLSKRKDSGFTELQFTLLTLILFQTMYKIIDLQRVEKVYIDLVETQWKQDDEPDFPLSLKVDFLFMLASIFNDYGHFTRSEKTIGVLEAVHNKYLGDTFIAYRYVLCLLGRSFDSWTVKYSSLDSYIQVIDQKISKYEFSAGQTKEIEFRKLKLS